MHKKASFLLLLISLFMTYEIVAQDASKIVRWEVETIDLGSITQGTKVANSYSFTNISDQPVEIDIVSTCDCTEAKWTQGAIDPGKKGVIDFVFDSSQKDHEETIDVDVYFMNIDPKNDRPYSTFLSYNFQFIQ